MEDVPRRTTEALKKSIDESSKKKKLGNKLVAKAEQRKQAPEANQLHGAEKAREHIGHMLVTAIESAPNSRQEKPLSRASGEAKIAKKKPQEQKTDRMTERMSEHRIETLNRADLLALSDEIIVDGSSLHKIYETHLIGERGLRRLVAEHLRGGDLKRALRREIVEREIDFERDPALRDMTLKSLPTKSIAGKIGNKEMLDKLLENASADFGDNNDQAAFFRARDNYDAHHHQHQSQTKRRLVDISLTATIASLIALILILILSSR